MVGCLDAASDHFTCILSNIYLNERLSSTAVWQTSTAIYREVVIKSVLLHSSRISWSTIKTIVLFILSLCGKASEPAATVMTI